MWLSYSRYSKAESKYGSSMVYFRWRVHKDEHPHMWGTTLGVDRYIPLEHVHKKYVTRHTNVLEGEFPHREFACWSNPHGNANKGNNVW